MTMNFAPYVKNVSEYWRLLMLNITMGKRKILIHGCHISFGFLCFGVCQWVA